MDSVIDSICYFLTPESRANNSDFEHQTTSPDSNDDVAKDDANMNDIKHILKRGKCMNARVLTGSRRKPLICTKMLIDSGNSGRSLISDKLAKTLNLELHECSYSIRTAQGGKVKILGETNALKFVMEKCKHE